MRSWAEASRFIPIIGQISPLHPPTADFGRNDNKTDSAGALRMTTNWLQ
jgi:hypothetical protein